MTTSLPGADLRAASRWRVSPRSVVALSLLRSAPASPGSSIWPADRASLPPHADGIVALTGGPERVETALRLLAEGRADRPAAVRHRRRRGTDRARPARRRQSAAAGAAGAIGRRPPPPAAMPLETAAWARANGDPLAARRHRRRTTCRARLLELRRSLPDIELIRSGRAAGRAPAGPRLTLRLIAEEYIKYLAAAVGLTAVLPEREPLRGAWRPRRMTVLRSALFNLFFFAATFVITAGARHACPAGRAAPGARMWRSCGRASCVGAASDLRHPTSRCHGLGALAGPWRRR